MADAGAGIHVVGTEHSTHQFLHDINFFIGAARGGNGTDRILAVLRLYPLDFAGGVTNGFFPRDLLPWVANALADHGGGDAILVRCITPGESTLDAGMAVVGATVLVGHHADYFLALHISIERAADAAISASGGNRVLGHAVLDDAVLHQSSRWAGLNAGTAGNAFGIHEVRNAGSHLGIKTARFDGQRERALGFFTGANATRTDDALGRIESEIGIGCVFFGTQMVLAVIAITHFAQAHGTGHVLQFAVAIGRASEAIQRMVGNVEFHDAAPDISQFGSLRMYLEPFGNGRRTRGRVTAPAFDFHHTQPAGAERFQAIGGAKLGDIDAGLDRGAHDGSAGRHGNFSTVDGQRDLLLGLLERRSIIFLRIHVALLAFPHLRQAVANS